MHTFPTRHPLHPHYENGCLCCEKILQNRWIRIFLQPLLKPSKLPLRPIFIFHQSLNYKRSQLPSKKFNHHLPELNLHSFKNISIFDGGGITAGSFTPLKYTVVSNKSNQLRPQQAPIKKLTVGPGS
jgi:hypothetical protein